MNICYQTSNGDQRDNFIVSFENVGNGVILMKFDTKDTSTALESENQEKNGHENSAKISENQVTGN